MEFTASKTATWTNAMARCPGAPGPSLPVIAQARSFQSVTTSASKVGERPSASSATARRPSFMANFLSGMVVEMRPLIVILFLCAAVNADARPLRYASQFDPGTMDPHALATLYNNRVTSQVYEGLVREEPRGEAAGL